MNLWVLIAVVPTAFGLGLRGFYWTPWFLRVRARRALGAAECARLNGDFDKAAELRALSLALRFMVQVEEYRR